MPAKTTKVSADGRRRDAKSGRIQPSTSPAELENALREIGAPATLQELKDKLGVTDPRTVTRHLMTGAGDPDSPIQARKSGGEKKTTWIFWLEEPAGEKEEEESIETKEYHNDLSEAGEGKPLICNVCGKEFQPGQTCYAIDKIKMVDQEEGEMQAILQVCEKCMPEKLKKASWDQV